MHFLNELNNIKILSYFVLYSVDPYMYMHLMAAVHSRRGNPRQGESENLDGNTRLALDPLV